MMGLHPYDLAPRIIWPDIEAPGDYEECECCKKPFAYDEESPRDGEVIQDASEWALCKSCAWEDGDEE